MTYDDVDEQKRALLSRKLSETPDDVTIDELEFILMNNGDEYWWMEVATVAIERLRNHASASIELANLIIEQTRSIAVAEEARKRYFGK